VKTPRAKYSAFFFENKTAQAEVMPMIESSKFMGQVGVDRLRAGLFSKLALVSF